MENFKFTVVNRFFAWRGCWWALAGLCGAMLAFAWAAEVLFHQLPCSLCIVQRGVMLALALGFALAAAARWRRLALGWVVLCCLAGIAASARHLWLIAHPEAAQCLPRFDVMLAYFPLSQALGSMLSGDVSCSQAVWEIFGVTVPTWLIVFYAGLLGLVTSWIGWARGQH